MVWNSWDPAPRALPPQCPGHGVLQARDREPSVHAGKGVHCLSLFPVLRSTIFDWRLIRNSHDTALPMPGGLGRSSGSASCEPLSLPCPKRRMRTPPSLPGAGGGSLKPDVHPARSTLQRASPGQLHRGLCTSGDPQWLVWDLNLGYCRPNPEPQPRAVAGELRGVQGLGI